MERNLGLFLAPVTFWLAITIIQAVRARRGGAPSPATPTDTPPDAPAEPVERAGTTASPVDAGREEGKSITVDELAGWMREHAGDRKPSDVVRAAVAEHGVSERTAWRAWDRAKPVTPGPLGRLFGGAR